MKTKFTKLPKDIPKWSNYFRAADSWLESLQILINNKDSVSWSIFYVHPLIIAFCIELYVKAITAHADVNFNGKNYYHKTNNILEDYAIKIPMFNKIKQNALIINLIKEYEKTVDVKFGEMAVQVNRTDQSKLIDIIYELRKELCIRTGLR